MTDLKAQEKLTNSKGWKFVKTMLKKKKNNLQLKLKMYWAALTSLLKS